MSQCMLSGEDYPSESLGAPCNGHSSVLVAGQIVLRKKDCFVYKGNVASSLTHIKG